ncbi:hypothetical protein [Paraburkholderia sediminicola]|uniref:hypothetical protein n=1 Tax=Paraburkholderia sediminicola TaxID=458836 RepID=UPI0038B8FBD7
MSYLAQKSKRLLEQPGLFGLDGVFPPVKGTDPFANEIATLRFMISRAGALGRFLNDGLDSLGDATIICDAHEKVTLCNGAAKRALHRNQIHLAHAEERVETDDILRGMFDTERVSDYVRGVLREDRRASDGPADFRMVERVTDGIEFVDRHGTDLSIRTADFQARQGKIPALSSISLIFRRCDVLSDNRKRR